jgi:hypothetical protein
MSTSWLPPSPWNHRGIKRARNGAKRKGARGPAAGPRQLADDVIRRVSLKWAYGTHRWFGCSRWSRPGAGAAGHPRPSSGSTRRVSRGPRLAWATARRHGISGSLLFAWRKAFREGRLRDVMAAGFAPAVLLNDDSARAVPPPDPRPSPDGYGESALKSGRPTWLDEGQMAAWRASAAARPPGMSWRNATGAPMPSLRCCITTEPSGSHVHISQPG